MGLPDRLLHDVTLVRPATATDRYNNTTYDYGAGATRTTIRAWLDANASTEPRAEGRDPMEGHASLLTDHTDIRGSDHIEDGGAVYEVIGPAGPVYQASQIHHYRAELRAITG